MLRILVVLGLAGALCGCADSPEQRAALRAIANTELTPMQGPQQRPQLNCTSNTYAGTTYTNCQ